jgi:hypothetical protein
VDTPEEEIAMALRGLAGRLEGFGRFAVGEGELEGHVGGVSPLAP